MTNDGLKQTTVEAATGTALTWNGDWHALFDQAAIPAGTFNGRLLSWLNAQLAQSYASLPQAQQAFAESQGALNWTQLGAFTIGGVVIPNLVTEAGANLVTEGGANIILEHP